MEKKSKKRAKITLANGASQISSWDFGTNTPAAKYMTVIEGRGFFDHKKGVIVNPNNIRGRRRISFIEKYYNNKTIDYNQYMAARALQQAYEATLKTKPNILVEKVDSTPKPNTSIDITIDRISNYHQIVRHIPAKYMRVISRVVLDNLPLPIKNKRMVEIDLMMLRGGLDCLCQKLRIG